MNPGDLRDEPGMSLSVDDRIDLVCDTFEDALSHGRETRVEQYVGNAQRDLMPALLLELVKIDVEYRLRSGEKPLVEEYTRRFPDYRGSLESMEFLPAPRPATTHAEIEGKLARFELVRKLGSGGFGTVWLARDTQLGRTVALKLPHNNLTPRDVELFLREARASAQLNHPNIVAVYDFSHDGQAGYIIYEYVEGMNLRERIAEVPLAPQAAASICAKVGHALDYIHSQGIVHRDIKPANIILDGSGEPRLTDLGLAKHISPDVTSMFHGSLVGTLPYIAPEQAQGEDAVGPLADIYSLGATLYELLTGAPPFRGTPERVLQQVVSGDVIAPSKVHSGVPRDLETICLKAMAKEPADRYESAQQMVRDLERFTRGEPVAARSITLVERSWRWTKRNRRFVLIQAALACLALGSAVTLLGTGRADVRKPTPSGLRTVIIKTNAPGATVAFVPLDRKTGEPRSLKMVRGHGQRASTADLPPGDYLVVAALDESRFHEVYRHVPDESEALPGIYRHNAWGIDDAGRIELPPIEIPPVSVTRGMTFVTGRESFEVGIKDSKEFPAHHRRISSYYMDPYEFSVGQYRRLFDGQAPRGRNVQARPDGHPADVTFDSAVAAAEKAGKRLPDEFEFEYAATAHRRRQHVVSVALQSKSPNGFAAVDSPTLDRIAVDPPVAGLLSNVAEWTSSRVGPQPSISQTLARRGAIHKIQIVRGGDLTVINGEPTVSPEHRDPRTRVVVAQGHRPGIGFRCVRSARPRLSPSSFGTAVGK